MNTMYPLDAPLIFNRDYFLYGTIPELEPIENQLARIFPPLENAQEAAAYELIERINDQFSPTLAEFRNHYQQMTDLRDSRGNTLLHRLVIYDRNIKYFNELIKWNHFDINAVNGAGDTALHIAARKTHSKYINPLLNHGADNKIENKMGLVPFQIFITWDSRNFLDNIKNKV